MLLDKSKDITIVLPPFILENIANDIQEVKGSGDLTHEDDSQVSEICDDDDFPQVDAELHKFAEQKLGEISGHHFANLHESNRSDFTDLIVPMIAPLAMIGGGEIIREVMSSDWQVPEVKISELLTAIPEKVVSEEVSEVVTVMPVNHHEVVIGDIPNEQVEVATEQLKTEVIADSVDEHVKILHDEEVIISNGEGSDKVRVTLTQKWVDSPKLTVRVNNESIPVISATIVIQDGLTGHAKIQINDEVTGLTEVKGINVQEYVGPSVAYERLPKYDLESDTPTLIGVTDEALSRKDDGSVVEPEVRARDADSILGALILIGVLLGNNNR